MVGAEPSTLPPVRSGAAARARGRGPRAGQKATWAARIPSCRRTSGSSSVPNIAQAA
jgi:hypothetical protein